jgi:DNA-binding LytR/AlgR family response regulator
MKVLIVEDEQLAAERLEQMIQAFDPAIEIVGPYDTVKESAQVIQEQTDLDVLFMDIQLADGKSFEVFDKILCDKPIIFTTAYDQYALRAFKLNSVDYLLKPIRPEELRQALEKFRRLNPAERPAPLSKEVLQEIIRSTQPAYKKRFLVKQGNKILYKSVDDIAYLFADGKLAYLVAREQNKQYIIDHTLEELEGDLLDPSEFFRISRKHLVHIKAIQEVRSTATKLEVVMAGVAEPLPVSRERATDFKQWLNQ